MRFQVRYNADRLLLAVVGILVVAALVTRPKREADSELSAEHAKPVAGNPERMSFTIELAGRQSQFRVGELIPLDIVYEFRQDGAYRINDGLAGGSGTARLLEVFRVTPQDGTRARTSDEPNFHRWAGGTPLPVKTDQVYRYRVALNEWRRFDQPGKYRFHSESARIWKPGVSPNDDRDVNDLRVTSNLLELEIVPATPEWQNEQIRQAVALLDRPDSSTDEHRPQRREAIRRLRYLDTEAATRELARRRVGRAAENYLRGPDEEEQEEVESGLAESLYKPSAIEEMEQRLEAPEFAVTASFVGSLARLRADVQVPVDFNAFGTGVESREKWNRLWAEHESLTQSLILKYSEAAWAAAENKLPFARAQTLLERLPHVSPFTYKRDPQPLSPDQLVDIGDAVRPVFDGLSEHDQYRILGHHWKRLGGTEFLPVLRNFIADADYRRHEIHRPSLLDLAFQRIVELAPEEGAELILAELRRPQPRATIATFKLLPARPIPELDQIFTRQIGDFDESVDWDLAMTLLARYGSPTMYDPVRQVYANNGGHFACAYQAAMLAYLIRINPKEGAEFVNQALNATAPNQTRCYQSVLTQVAAIQMLELTHIFGSLRRIL